MFDVIGLIVLILMIAGMIWLLAHGNPSPELQGSVYERFKEDQI